MLSCRCSIEWLTTYSNLVKYDRQLHNDDRNAASLLIVHFGELIKFGFKFGCRLRLELLLKKLTWLRARLHLTYFASTFLVSCFLSFIFSACMNSNCTAHAYGFIVQELHLAYCASTFLVSHFFFPRIWIVIALFMHMDSLCKRQSALFTGPTPTLFRKKILKTVIMTLSTHLKIILLPCFQLSIFSKRSCIRTDPIK